MREADRLAAHVEILELEVALAYLSHGIPYGARRDPFPHEVRAPINLATIKHRLDMGGSDVFVQLRQARVELTSLLVAWLMVGNPSPADVMRRLDELVTTSTLPPGVPDMLAQLRGQVRDRLSIVSDGALSDTAAEAEDMGVPTDDIDLGPVDDTLDVQASRVVTGLWLSIVAAMRNAAAGIPVANQPGVDGRQVASWLQEAAAGVSLAGLADQAKQAANAAQGMARIIGLRALRPGDGKQLVAYASELLDDSTCDSCAVADGTQYESLDQAFTEYPGGQFAMCKGGTRCRGQLVVLPRDSSIAA